MSKGAVAKLVVALSLAVALAGCQREQEYALQLLRRAQQAERTVALEGQATIQLNAHGRQVQAVAEVKRWPDPTVITFIKGAIGGQQLIRQGQQWWRVGPGGARQEMPGWDLAGLPPVEEIAQRYRLCLGKTTLIAGHNTVPVTIQPPKPQRGPRITLWIDRNTGFALARERRDAAGRVVSATRYLQVNYGVPSEPAPEPPARPGDLPPSRPPGPLPGPSEGAVPPGLGQAGPGEVTPPRPPGLRAGLGPGVGRPRGPGYGGQGPPGPQGEQPRGRPQRVTLEELGKQLEVTLHLPKYLPEGFVLRGIFVPEAGRPGRGGVVHYSDGVRAFNILVHRREAAGQKRIPPQAEGPGQAVLIRRSRGVMALAVRGQVIYVVTGSLPEPMLHRIAASIP